VLYYIRVNHNSSNLKETEKQKIRNFVIDLLGNDPINSIKEIVFDDNFGSLRTISDHFRISRPTLRIYISNWLELIYGKNEVEHIIKQLWPPNSAKQKEKLVFNDKIEKYYRLYPERVNLIPTRNELLKRDFYRIVSKNTFKLWIMEYLTIFKNKIKIESQAIYDEVWGRKCATRRKIGYKDVIDFIYQRSHGTANVLTPKTSFDLNYNYPTDRYIKLIYGEGHEFSIQV
jgi:hypothetical protein